MKTLFILNDPPYGTERSWPASGTGAVQARRQSASSCWATPPCAPRPDRRCRRVITTVFATSILKRGVQIGVCGVCMEACALRDEERP